MKKLALSFLVFIFFGAGTGVHAQNGNNQTGATPLVRLLQSKGIITEQEAAAVADSEQRLVALLISKGIINRDEYDQAAAVPSAPAALRDTSNGRPVHRERGIVEAAHTPGVLISNSAPNSQGQIEGAVTSQSKLPVKLYGQILFNSTYVDRGSNTNDIPLFAQKRGVSSDQNHQNFNMTVRQSRFGLRYESKIFSDAKLTGVFEFDLLGGKPAFPNGIDFDIFRVRLAYARIDWEDNSLEVGQDWTVFSPLNPTTIASYAIPGFSASGNLWNRIPQIRYEHREGKESKLVVAAALLDPNAGDNSGTPAFRSIGLGERGSLPAFETRIGFTAPTHGRDSSAGIGGHYSRLLGVPGNPAGTAVRSPIDSYGIGGDASLWVSSGIRIAGETFHGRALGIFSGNVLQSSVVVAGRARGINSTGGWFEVHCESPIGYEGEWKRLSANFGYGIENNRDEDLVEGIRKRNQTYMVNGQYKLSPNFTFALEYRRVLTDWFNQPSTAQKMNWGNVAFLYSF